MTLLKKPHIHAVAITLLSIFYATIFIVTSGHIEFQNILNHGQTLNSAFWNSWARFLQQGNLKYMGISILLLQSAYLSCHLFEKRTMMNIKLAF